MKNNKIIFLTATMILVALMFWVNNSDYYAQASMEEPVQEETIKEDTTKDEKVQNEIVQEKPVKDQKAEKMLNLQKNEKAVIDKIITEVYGDFSSFTENGVVYLTPDGEIVMGFKVEDEKVKKFKSKLKEKVKDDKYKFKEIKYSINDLEKLQDTLLEYIDRLNINPNDSQIATTSIDVVGPKLYLELEKITDEQTKVLNQQFGSILQINVLPKSEIHTPEPTIARQRNWTKLGGGITIDFGKCSTTGVGKKGTNYFLITAGHCLSADGGYVFQDSEVVGRDHSKASYAGLDAGLIRITNDNTLSSGRYATNYFYEYAQDNDDYDARITGWGNVWQNTYVCKSGNITNVTCGYVYRYDTTWKYSGDPTTYKGVEIQTETPGKKVGAKGDSGAIVYDPSTNKVYGIFAAIDAETGYYGFYTRIGDVINNYSTSSESFTLYTSSTNTLVAN